MKTKYVVSRKNQQSNFISVAVKGVIIYTVLDYWQAPMWLVGFIMGLIALGFISSILEMVFEEAVDLFDDKENDSAESRKGKSKFQERLDELAKERGIKSN